MRSFKNAMHCHPNLHLVQERLQLHEWAAAAVAFIGVLGLGASSEPSHLDHPEHSATRILTAFLAMVLLLGRDPPAPHPHTRHAPWGNFRLFYLICKRGVGGGPGTEAANASPLPLHPSMRSARVLVAPLAPAGAERGSRCQVCARALRDSAACASDVIIVFIDRRRAVWLGGRCMLWLLSRIVPNRCVCTCSHALCSP